MAVALPIILFSLLILPFLGIIPYLDGNIEFRIAHNFYSGNYLTNWATYHPPLKPLMSSVLFFFFGVSAYTLLGYLLGVAGIISIYFIAKKIFDKQTAVLSAIFLALSGLYVSTSLFSLNDFIMTVFLLISFAFYVHKKYLLYAVAISLAVCAKETAIIFPVSIMLVEAFHKQFRWQHLLPIMILGGWILFLKTNGHGLWNAWNFSESQHKGIIYTVMDNIFSLKMFNAYAYENWRHLFIFNYNWVFWLLAMIAIPKLKIDINTKIFLAFTVLYAGVILTIQTYTITRYVLPVLPFVYIIAAHYLVQLKQYKVFAITIVMLIVTSALFTSDDPVSNSIWKKTTMYDRSFYSQKLDGNDGITYNLQFLQLAKERDSIIRKEENPKASLFIDKLTLALYKLDR
jgi:4-amino-4-deoxy-L-arabinose transferase-like glycosyltransferase